MEPAATLEAAYVMCQAIKEYYDKTGTMIGFKPAGGISTTEDAVKYYCIVAEVLGEKWLDKKYFRLGASRLANNLLSSIARSNFSKYKKERDTFPNGSIPFLFLSNILFSVTLFYRSYNLK